MYFINMLCVLRVDIFVELIATELSFPKRLFCLIETLERLSLLAPHFAQFFLQGADFSFKFSVFGEETWRVIEGTL